MGGSRGGTGGSGPLKNHKNIGFLFNNGPDALKNHKATKPAFNVGSSSARQRNAISMAFGWRSDDGRFMMVFGSSIIPSSTKNTFLANPIIRVLYSNPVIQEIFASVLNVYLRAAFEC